mmetsp:Transcript_1180/g.2508  ORF Transcript_1180/g.2508 Transcript_1180/m.2508 type:complete len:271 (+) Transcript_1180:1153-1965(+)
MRGELGNLRFHSVLDIQHGLGPTQFDGEALVEAPAESPLGRQRACNGGRELHWISDCKQPLGVEVERDQELGFVSRRGFIDDPIVHPPCSFHEGRPGSAERAKHDPCRGQEFWDRFGLEGCRCPTRSLSVLVVVVESACFRFVTEDSEELPESAPGFGQRFGAAPGQASDQPPREICRARGFGQPRKIRYHPDVQTPSLCPQIARVGSGILGGRTIAFFAAKSLVAFIVDIDVGVRITVAVSHERVTADRKHARQPCRELAIRSRTHGFC